jgi:hypothetical protein
VFTRALHWSLSWARSIQSTPSHPISLRSILILSTHVRLGHKLNVLPVKISLKLFDDDVTQCLKQIFWTLSFVGVYQNCCISEVGYISVFRRTGYETKRTKLGPLVEALLNHGYYSLALSLSSLICCCFSLPSNLLSPNTNLLCEVSQVVFYFQDPTSFPLSSSFLYFIRFSWFFLLFPLALPGLNHLSLHLFMKVKLSLCLTN